MTDIALEASQDADREARIRGLFGTVEQFLALTGLYIVAGSEITKTLEILARWHDPRRAILHIMAVLFLVGLIAVVQYFFVISFRLAMRRVFWQAPRRLERVMEGVILLFAGVTQVAVALTFISGFYDLAFLGEVFMPFDALMH
ncbi:MAG: hypothetical protein AB1592_05745 [Pseudomonadota bacterium]